MDDETRTAIANLGETMVAGFARMDHYFQLQQGQFLEFRAEVNARLDALTERVDRLEAEVAALRQEVDSLRNELRAFRDWTTREIADLRRDMSALRASTKEWQTEARRDVDHLGNRVDGLEERLDELGG
jgi:outer membrane murein-binding lipoprotein Lpp